MYTFVVYNGNVIWKVIFVRVGHILSFLLYILTCYIRYNLIFINIYNNRGQAEKRLC